MIPAHAEAERNINIAAEGRLEMTNKELVLKFYEEVFNGWDLTNLDLFMRDDYMQHNGTVADGKEGFKAFAAKFLALKPHMEIQKIFENEDHVAVFFKCTLGVNGSVNKVVDIYRLEDGKLAEHWDVVEHDVGDGPLPNGRSIF